MCGQTYEYIGIACLNSHLIYICVRVRNSQKCTISLHPNLLNRHSFKLIFRHRGSSEFKLPLVTPTSCLENKKSLHPKYSWVTVDEIFFSYLDWDRHGLLPRLQLRSPVLVHPGLCLHQPQHVHRSLPHLIYTTHCYCIA